MRLLSFSGLLLAALITTGQTPAADFVMIKTPVLVLNQVRVLPKHPNLDQLKRQARELLDAVRAGEPNAVSEVAAQYPGADRRKFALHDAQLVLARTWVHSWPRLRAYLRKGMIKPPELESDRGRYVWDTITAAATSNTITLRRLIERDRNLSRAEYFTHHLSSSRCEKGMLKPCESCSTPARQKRIGTVVTSMV